MLIPPVLNAPLHMLETSDCGRSMPSISCSWSLECAVLGDVPRRLSLCLEEHKARAGTSKMRKGSQKFTSCCWATGFRMSKFNKPCRQGPLYDESQLPSHTVSICCLPTRSPMWGGIPHQEATLVVAAASIQTVTGCFPAFSNEGGRCRSRRQLEWV